MDFAFACPLPRGESVSFSHSGQLPYTQLPKLTQQCCPVQSGKRQSSQRNFSELGHSHRHGARGFAIQAGTENYDGMIMPRRTLLREIASNGFPI